MLEVFNLLEVVNFKIGCAKTKVPCYLQQLHLKFKLICTNFAWQKWKKGECKLQNFTLIKGTFEGHVETKNQTANLNCKLQITLEDISEQNRNVSCCDHN